MKPRPFKYDLAYGCFAFCGLTALIIGAAEAGMPSHDIAVGLSFLLAFLTIPLVLASGGAMLVGVVLSLYLWKQRPLLVLSGMSVLLVAALLTEFGSTKMFFKTVALIYGSVAVVISGMWFLVLRRRHFPVMAGDYDAVQPSDAADR